MTQTEEFIARIAIPVCGFAGTIITLLFGIRQYRRAEQWRRGEFIAREIKEFESDPVIRNALLMIDWGKRRINLFLIPEPQETDLVRITRTDQSKALLPHPLKNPHSRVSCTSDEESTSDIAEPRFTAVEARIRDTYDALLDRLERFANSVESGLISSDELQPYLAYWIKSITRTDGNEEDAMWRCVLLTYIHYYDYTGIEVLLKRQGFSIEPRGELYGTLGRMMKNEQLRGDLLEVLKAPVRS